MARVQFSGRQCAAESVCRDCRLTLSMFWRENTQGLGLGLGLGLGSGLGSGSGLGFSVRVSVIHWLRRIDSSNELKES